MKKQKILAIALAAVLLLASVLGASVLADNNGTPDNNAASSGGGGTYPVVPEVTVKGVQVDNEHLELGVNVSAKSFQTLGLVLSYDATVLEPITWTENGEAVAVQGSSWSDPSVIPTKGADGLSGKPALAYAEYTAGTDGTDTPTGRAFLYLGADALKYTDLTDTRVVTVRFRYREGKDQSMVTMPGLTGSGASGTGDTIDFAPDGVAQEAIPGYRLLVTTGGGDDGTLRSWVYGEDYSDLSATVPNPYSVTFDLGPGPSVNTGTGGGGDFAITFFDWDGKVIDAIAADKNAQSAKDAWQSQNSIQAVLGSKLGYTFEDWLLVKQTDDGLKSEHEDLTSRKTSEPNNAPQDVVDFTNLEAYAGASTGSYSVLVQAAYRTTGDVNGGTGDNGSLGEDTARYKIRDIYCYQYGAADADNGQYAIRGTVSRGDALRADVPVLMAQVSVSAGGNSAPKLVTVKVDLENTDTTTFEVVVPKAAAQVTLRTLDTYGYAVWTTSRARSQDSNVLNADFVKEGAFNKLMDEAVNAYKDAGHAWDETVNAQLFIDAGYSLVNTNNVSSAEAALLAKVTAMGGTVLSRADADSALAAYK